MHDIDPARLALAEQLAHISLRHHGRQATVRASADLRAALDGADFVINTVNIGGHAATVTDFDVPESFGVRQTIADTLGTGGIFRGLRTFPFLDELGRAITEVCPDAWLLNYTNPMAMNIGYLAATHPEVKVLGLCHSVYWTLVDLGELVGAPFDQIDFRSAGVNHQAWILDWQLDGREPLRPPRPARSRPTPSCAAGCASTCTSGSASTRPRPASTPRSTCRGTSTTTPRSSACDCRSATTSASARPTSRRPSG